MSSTGKTPAVNVVSHQCTDQCARRCSVVSALNGALSPPSHSRWVQLTPPRGAGSGGAAAIRGYLRLSVTILGPGDTPKAHNLVAEEEAAREQMLAAAVEALLDVGARDVAQFPAQTAHVVAVVRLARPVQQSPREPHAIGRAPEEADARGFHPTST